MNNVTIVTYIHILISSQLLTISPLLSIALLLPVFSQKHFVSFYQFSTFLMPHSMPFLLYCP